MNARTDTAEVSSEACRQYNSGRHCPRMKKGGCPYVHDNYLRSEALKMRSKAKKLAAKNKGKSVARAKQQSDHGKGSSNRDSTKATALNNADIKSSVRSDLQLQTDLERDFQTACSLNSPATDSSNQDEHGTETIHDPGELFRTQDARSGTSHKHLRFPKSGYSATSAGIALFNSSRASTYRGSYSSKVFSKMYVHSKVLSGSPPRNNIAFNNIVSTKSLQSNANNTNPNSRNGDSSNRAASTQDDTYRPLCFTVVTKKIPTAPGHTLNTPGSVVKFVDFNSSWEAFSLANWARDNLRPTTCTKLLDPYLKTGMVPLSVFQYPDSTEETSFPRFSDIPAEIRIKIWNFAMDSLNRERIVKVKYNGHNAEFRPAGPAPTLLHVNIESRQLAMQRYQETLGTPFGPARIWFDYTADVLFIPTFGYGEVQTVTQLMRKADRVRIKRLALPLRDYLDNRNGFLNTVCRYANMEVLYLRVADTIEDTRWARDEDLQGILRTKLKLIWDRNWRKFPRPMPKVVVERVDGLVAKLYGYAGIYW